MIIPLSPPTPQEERFDLVMKFGSKIRDYDNNSFKQEIYLIVIVICEEQVGIKFDIIKRSSLKN